MRLPTVGDPRRCARLAGLLLSAIIAAAAIVPAGAQGPSLAMLRSLDAGQWEVRKRDSGEVRRICVHSGHELIQIQHTEAGCSRFVVEDGADAVTVQYTCRGNGYGRTSIRRESAGLAQIASQGIAGGLPFEFTAEARRVGACR